MGKRIFFICLLLLIMALFQFSACTKLLEPTAITGTQSLSWTQATGAAAFTGRAEHASVIYNGQMWVIAGSGGTYPKDAWSSTDGISWTGVTRNAAFSGRYGHSALVYTNATGPDAGTEKMWVMGGYNGVYQSDVWYSTGGSLWTQATALAAFGSRAEPSSVVFNGSMWVIAGGTTGDVLHNDVYSSEDGVNWTSVTLNAAFHARKLHTSVVYNNKIWVIAGNMKTKLLNDVWYSSDGVNWYAATQNAQFTPRYGHSSVVFNNKMWVIGGADNTPGDFYKNDCWYSGDGITWTKAAVTNPFAGRAFHTSLVFGSKIWVMAGANTINGYMSNVWSGQ